MKQDYTTLAAYKDSIALIKFFKKIEDNVKYGTDPSVTHGILTRHELHAVLEKLEDINMRLQILL